MKKQSEPKITKPEAVISSWKDLACFFGVTVRAVRFKYTKSLKTPDPMPILNYDGIVVIPEDLREWLRRQHTK